MPLLRRAVLRHICGVSASDDGAGADPLAWLVRFPGLLRVVGELLPLASFGLWSLRLCGLRSAGAGHRGFAAGCSAFARAKCRGRMPFSI